MTLFVSLLVLVLVWGGYGGLYLYERSIQVSIDEKKTKLREFNDQFDRPLIARAQALEKKINTAGSIIKNHTTVFPIFEVFEQSTVSSAYISDFRFVDEENASTNASALEESGPGSDYVLSLTAVTPGFAAAADLEEAFMSRTDIFTSVKLMSSALMPETGDVSVEFTIGVKPEFVTYGKVAPTNGVSPAASIGTVETQEITSDEIMGI